MGHGSEAVLQKKANAILFARAGQRLEALLAERPAENPSELTKSQLRQLLERATLEAAASISSTGDPRPGMAVEAEYAILSILRPEDNLLHIFVGKDAVQW